MKIGRHRLEVAYKWTGDTSLDAIVHKLVGKKEWASGCGFGERDLSFDFDTKRKADNARIRVKKDKRFTVTEVWYDKGD